MQAWGLAQFCSIAGFAIFLLNIKYSYANRGYLVVTPSVYRPNTEEGISVTIFQPSLPILVEAKLYSPDGHLLTQSAQQIFGKGTMKLKIPDGVSGRCNLKICGNCVRPKMGSYTFYNSSLIMVQDKGASAFVTTDRPIYKPEQTVYVTIITTGPDLRPYNTEMLIYIEDPRGSRLMQWKDIRPPCCGVLNLSYPLSDQPLLGKWKVVVQLHNHAYNRTFEIQKYVLPKFEVSVHTPSYIKDWKNCEPIYVRSRYLYGKEVEGDLTASVTVKGVAYYQDFVSSTAVKHMKISGVASFNVCLHHLMTKAVGEHFQGILLIEALVRTPDGSSMKTTDTACRINKQLIDVKFSDDTRHHFKPGLPYRGKIEVTFPDGSPADNITIRVKANVNGMNYITRNYLSSAGKVIFHIPSLPSMAQSVWLEAKISNIGGKTVERYYFPTYMSISSWYSPSKCHLLVEGHSDTLWVGEDARFFVHSSCPCNFTMYYEVMARGNIVQSGIHFARHSRHRRDVIFDTYDPRMQFHQVIPEEHQDTSTCKIFVKFPVTHEMAPVSKLLAYYVKETGEGVADIVSFKVHPSYRNKMSISLSTQSSLPGEDVNVQVETKPDSFVCLTAVDRSMLVLRPEARLNTEQVFHELTSYDIATDMNQETRHHRARRSAMWWNPMQAKDALYAFQESGALVLTDTVRLHFRQEPFSSPGSMFYRPSPGFYQTASMTSNYMPKNNVKLHKERSYFPETWFAVCFNVTQEAVRVRAPDSVTSWQVDGISMSAEHGLALAEPVRLRTFQPFFLDFTLPYSVVKGEQLRIPITVYNYLHACLRVHLLISKPEHVRFLREDQTVSKFCVGSEDTKLLFLNLVFEQLGQHNITASADAFYDSRCCSGILVEPRGPQLKTASDTLQAQILCEPEGVPKNYIHSVFFCPKERVHISTPNRYEFQYVKKPSTAYSVTVSVKASNDARISLSPEPADNPGLLELVLGGQSNTHSWLASGLQGPRLVEAETKNILSAGEFRKFTISWQDDHILVANGETIDSTTVILNVTKPSNTQVEYIGCSTGWGATGAFKITWQSEADIDSTYREVFYLGLPDNYIEGSVKAKARLVGDVMGPSLWDLEKLLHLPQGCGEQNMVRFAPKVYIMRYLDLTGQLKHDTKHTAFPYLLKGYQRQLTYRRKDGSYSAFGDRDNSGNMWLTAFVMKSFAQAIQYMYVEQEELRKGKTWILQQQRVDGSFPAIGRLINKDMQGGLHGIVSLTSYVIIALKEIGLETEEEQEKVKSAQHYLESSVSRIKDPYSLALTGYALTLLRSSKAAKVVQLLNALATKRVSSAEVETASYALLTMTTQGDLAAALPIVKWLSQQRNSHGGFHSTQDTCVALEALSRYALLVFSNSTNLTVSLASTNMDLQESFEVNPNTSSVLQSTDIPSLPAGLFVSAEGEGCALLQIDVSYNIPDPTLAPSFSLNVHVTPIYGKLRNKTHRAAIINNALLLVDEFRVNIHICVRWLHRGSSNMAVLEAAMLSGFEADIETLDALLKDEDLKLKRFEISGKTVVFYFDEIQSQCTMCVSFEAFRRHMIGRTHPAAVKVYDYYEPGYETTVFYNASHLDVLTRSLCDSEATCNQIEEHVSHPEKQEGCNSILGCNEGRKDLGTELCSCNHECPAESEQVCGSDGLYHDGLCHMGRLSCQLDIHLQAMPHVYCQPDLADNSYDAPGTSSSLAINNTNTESMNITDGITNGLYVYESSSLNEEIYNITDYAERENATDKYLGYKPTEVMPTIVTEQTSANDPQTFTNITDNDMNSMNDKDFL